MINWIWMGLVVVGVIAAAINGRMAEITKAAFDAARTAVELSIGLIGIMALWLGLMKIAEGAGLVQALAKLVRPVMRRLFPDVPPEHPAMGSMLSNIAANALGLGNSATALGLKAMQDLQSLNEGDKETATDAMVVFLAINTTAITIIPATVIGLRVAAGSVHPTAIIPTTIISCATATVVAVISAKLLGRMARFRREKRDA